MHPHDSAPAQLPLPFDTAPTKRCTRCQVEKPLGEFPPRPNRPSGYQSRCRACTAQLTKTWRQENPERASEAGKRWRKANPEKVRASGLRAAIKWQRRNPERHRAYLSEYNASEPGKARGRKWARKNADYFRRWEEAHRAARLERGRLTARRRYALNPFKALLKNHRYYQRKFSARGVPFTEEQVRQKVAYWGTRCAYCRGPYEAIDHVVPLSRGGWHCLANLRPACRSCNSSKGASLLSEWIRRA